MKIIRWLLSHSFLILLIVIVIYGYMFWGNLLGKDTPAGKAVAYLSSEFVEVEEFVNAVKAKHARLNGDTVSTQSASEAASSETIDTAPPANTVESPEIAAIAESEVVESGAIVHEVAATENAVDIEAANDVSGKQSAEQVNIQQLSVNTSQESAQQAPADVIEPKVDETLIDSQDSKTLNEVQSVAPQVAVAMMDSDVKETFVSPEIERQLKNVDDQGKVLDESQRSGVVRTNWITARKSFYQRNYALSEQNYRAMIAGTEDNFDAYGELGNVYFNQGKKQQAATAYFEAAAILVRKGQIDRARSLVGLLNLLNKEKADELRQLIDTAMS